MFRLFLALNLCFLFSFERQLSISGKIYDTETLEPLTGVNIQSSNSANASDKEGLFVITISNIPDSIVFNYIGYQTEILVINNKSKKIFDIGMKKKAVELDIIVVSASATEKRLEEETVSVDVIKPYLIRNNNITNMSVAVEKVPGVKIIDGQISIRNGAGWAYSAGSRVQVLVDGQSYLATGLGDVKWNFLPTDVKQVEVIKGSSSVLYGSSSMNGVVNILTEWPEQRPEAEISFYSAYYNKPERRYAAWWSQDFIHIGSYLYQQKKINDLPYYNGCSFQYKRKIGTNFDFVFGGRVNKKHSYLKLVDEYNLGLNVKTRYRDPKIKGLLYGINTNLMYEQNDRFFFFNDTSDGSYIPLTTGDDPLIAEETYNSLSIVPHITYIPSEDIKHSLTSPYFSIIQIDDDNFFPSNKMGLNYQFQKKLNQNFSLTSGFDYTYGWIVNTNLFNALEPYTNSKSVFSQLETKIGKLTINLGFRTENYQINNIPTNNIDSVLYEVVGPDTTMFFYDSLGIPNTIISIPLDTTQYDLQSSFNSNSGFIKRLGVNYQINPTLYLRSSYGEGFRNPSLIERYMRNYNNDDIWFGQNPILKSESGWSSEIGLKQIIPFDKSIGYLDLAFFWMEYKDYIELVFTQTYVPEQDEEEVGNNYFNFEDMTDGSRPTYRAQNIGRVRIIGYELTSMGDFNFFGYNYKFLAGYTFTYPVDLNIIEDRPNGKTFWEYFIDSFDGLDDEYWQDNNFNDYYDEGDIFCTEQSENEGCEGKNYDQNNDGVYNNEVINILPFRHRNSARIDLESKYKNLLYGISIDYNSGLEHIGWFMENFLGNLIGDGGNKKFKYHEPYTLINLRFSYSFYENSNITLNIKNAMNIEYAHRPGYMGEPRSIVLQYNYKL